MNNAVPRRADGVCRVGDAALGMGLSLLAMAAATVGWLAPVPADNDIRTHRSLDKDAPVSRPAQRTGSIKSFQILGGLHHHYVLV